MGQLRFGLGEGGRVRGGISFCLSSEVVGSGTLGESGALGDSGSLGDSPQVVTLGDSQMATCALDAKAVLKRNGKQKSILSILSAGLGDLIPLGYDKSIFIC